MTKDSEAFSEFNFLLFHCECNFDLLLSFPNIQTLAHF
jgi:hypothetical protein